MFFGSGDEEETYSSRSVQIDGDFNSLRRELWLATDAAYKQAAEALTKKEASLKNRMRKDTTADFTYIAPDKNYDTIPFPVFDIKKFENVCKQVSAIFLNYPTIQTSAVGFEFIPKTVFYINSEGREYVKTQMYSGLEIAALAQSEDGMQVTNLYSAHGFTPGDLPDTDSLTNAAKELAGKVSAFVPAKALEEPYSGPVLFEKQAAAQMFAQVFAPNLATLRQPISEGGMQESERNSAFQTKIGGRVLPEFLSITDSPSKSKIGNMPLVGHYKFDDDGVLAEDITIVDKGYLKTLASCRVPTKRVRMTNGHNRGGAAMFSVLELSADKKHQKTNTELKKQMLKLCKARELPFGIIIKRITDINMLYTTLMRISANTFPFPMGNAKMPVIEAYKIYPDGREELVRGCEANGFTVQSFKDILNVSNTNYIMNYLAPAVTSPYMSGGEQFIGSTVIVPDLLFEDGEIRPLEGDFPKPPILSNPISKSK
jgi:hypothetical protein